MGASILSLENSQGTVLERLLAEMERFQESLDMQEACTHAPAKVRRLSDRQTAAMHGVDTDLRKAVVLAKSKASLGCHEVRLVACTFARCRVLNVICNHLPVFREEPQQLHLRGPSQPLAALSRPRSLSRFSHLISSRWLRDYLASQIPRHCGMLLA